MQRISMFRDRVEMLVPPLPWDRPRWRDIGGEPVVLLHGLWRGWRAMEPMARALRREGFSTLNLPYPSTRLSIPQLVSLVRAEVEKIAGAHPVHFVTHSLGGILARALLSDTPPWIPGKLIMLAPPNGGSEIVDWSRRHPVIQSFLGPAGRALGTDGIPAGLPDPAKNSETAVIMGSRCSLPIFKHLLEDGNDGIVSVNRGRINELRDFSVVDADHTFIQMHPETIRRVLRFLKSTPPDS